MLCNNRLLRLHVGIAAEQGVSKYGTTSALDVTKLTISYNRK